MPLDKADLKDAGFVDAAELAADGARTSAFRTLAVVSITASTKRVVVHAAEYLTLFRDAPVEVGDLFTLAGATGGNGDYTVAAIVDEQTFDVAETVGGNGTGGTGSFYYPAGATKVGGVVSGVNHETIDSLVHELAETSYTEVTRANGQVTDIIVWTSAAKLTKVRETNITRSGGAVSQVVEKQYNAAGALVQTLTHVLTRANGAVTSITTTET